MSPFTVEIPDAVVVGVNNLQSCKASIKCDSTNEKMNDTVGIHSKCSLVQTINRCPSELSVKLVISDPENALHTFQHSRYFSGGFRVVYQNYGMHSVLKKFGVPCPLLV